MYDGIEKQIEYAEITGEDIDLTPDMSKTWGTVLKGLRESGENMLYAACSEIKNIDYTQDTIEIKCKDESLYTLLTKHKPKLEKLAGSGCVNIYKPTDNTNGKKHIIDGLTRLFGDKLVIK